MGTWDELCLVCGVCPAGGPHALLSRNELEDEARKIATAIDRENAELVAIVMDALSASFSPDEKTLGFRYEWLPDGMGSVSGEEHHYATGICIAVGYFGDEFGGAPLRDDKVPDGRNVQIRQVTQDSGGSFSALVCTRGRGDETVEYCPSNCSTAAGPNCNFFVHQRCYCYLKAWTDHDSLPSPNNNRSLSFAGEIYELLNSRQSQRNEHNTLFPGVYYAGIEASLDQWQSFFIHCRREVERIKRAIESGLRGKDLIPAILRDCRAWMFMRPDMWPVPPAEATKFAFSAVKPSTAPAPAICSLPNEILLPILCDLSVVDLLSLSATCRSARCLVTNPPFLNRVLQDALLKGSCRYLLPVRGLRDEEERFFEAIRLWLPGDLRPAGMMEDEVEYNEAIDEVEDGIVSDYGEEEEEADSPERLVPPFKPLLLEPRFPALAFIQACVQSDSMRNRQRLWGLVRQIEDVWREYRMTGWEVERFYPSEEILGDLHDDPVECRPPCEREESTGQISP